MKGGVSVAVHGYSGYYKGIYLRSTLEFAYAYYLDSKGIKWDYERETYDLGEFTYKPDFFLLDENGEVYKIVEIKGEGNREIGIKKAEKFSEIYGIPVELIFREDLVRIYREEMDIRYHTLERKWREEYGAVLEQNVSGEFNPMHGVKQKESTKKKISEKAKMRFKTGKYDWLTKRLIEYNRANNFEAVKKPRSPRVVRYCKRCGSEFKVTVASPKRFCSQKCAAQENFAMATEAYLEKVHEKYNEIRNEVFLWAQDNAETVKSIKLNKITPTLAPLLAIIKDKYGVTDFRTISKAVTGKDCSRKDLVKYIQSNLY